MSGRLKIGVLGAGHLGRIHLRLLKELDCFDLVGLYDPDLQRAQKAEADFGVHLFGSVAELLDAVEAVDIVTPTLSHFDCASRALKKSRHCFIEKPLTSSLNEARQLSALLAGSGLKVQVGHVERFNPAYVAVRPYCRNPMFVEVHRLAEFNPRGTDVSVVYDLMIHDIDIVLSLIPADVKQISASGVAVVSNSPDIANARIEFENNCVANLTASRISMKNMRKMRLFQRDAYISMDFLEKKAEIIRMETAGKDEDDPFAIIIEPGDGLPKKRIFFESPEIDENANALKDELASFASSVLQDKTPAITLEDGLNALSVAERVAEIINRSSNLNMNIISE